MTEKATFHFHDSLNFFLPKRQKKQPVQHSFSWKASVKDMVESLGVPHPEVDLLLVNEQSVGWDYIVQANDEIHVYPYESPIEISPRVALVPPYPGRPRFILDTHLGRLAAYLRMMGFDTLYRNDYPDDELARVSHEEERILLTRDIGLLKRSLVMYGYFVRNTKPRLRILEIARRYHLAQHIQPFKHCMKCNGQLTAVEKEQIPESLPGNTLVYYDAFHRCQSCQQIYWKGSHYQRMETLLRDVLQAL